MHIKLQNVGKRFERNWIFRNLSQEFKEGSKYAVLGPNGSGKSTLLRVISGSLTLSEGEINYTYNNSDIKSEEIYSHVSITAPYLDLPEEYSLEEIITFHKTFKKIDLNTKELITKLLFQCLYNRTGTGSAAAMHHYLFVFRKLIYMLQNSTHGYKLSAYAAYFNFMRFANVNKNEVLLGVHHLLKF